MMSPKTRRNILIAILVALALLIAFLLWFFLKPKPKPVVIVPPVVAEKPLPTAPTKPTVTQEKAKKEQAVRTASASLQSASKTFAERYGSYSTEANFANLTDVLPLMSASYAATTAKYIETAVSPKEYYGVTTRVITVKIDAEDDAAGTAQVTLTTQREEARGDVQNVTVKYQDLVLSFVKEGGEWKVENAVWK